MAAVHHLGFPKIQILVTSRVGRPNWHQHNILTFIKIGQMLVEITHLMVFKMAAICPLEFFKT